MTPEVNEVLLRSLTPRALGFLVRRGTDFAVDEGRRADALVEAVRVWSAAPSPSTSSRGYSTRDPKGWLGTVAWRRFLDATRADAARRRREFLVDEEPALGSAPDGGRHAPALLPVRPPVADAVVPGRAHAARRRRADHPPPVLPGLPGGRGDHGDGGVPGRRLGEDQRRSGRRAKPSVSGVRFDRPGDVGTVLRVPYLVFNEGYSGDIDIDIDIDIDLAAEAIRLARRLAAAIDHPQVAGRLALMVLHRARRAARTAPDGSLAWCCSPSRTATGGALRRSPRASRSFRRPSPSRRGPGGSRRSRPRSPRRGFGASAGLAPGGGGVFRGSGAGDLVRLAGR